MLGLVSFNRFSSVAAGYDELTKVLEAFHLMQKCPATLRWLGMTSDFKVIAFSGLRCNVNRLLVILLKRISRVMMNAMASSILRNIRPAAAFFCAIPITNGPTSGQLQPSVTDPYRPKDAGRQTDAHRCTTQTSGSVKLVEGERDFAYLLKSR